MLRELRAADPQRVSLLSLSENAGKAEAVRRGMLQSLEAPADIVGFYDADLATPPDELIRILNVLEDSTAQVATAARVSLLGRNIHRNPARHYLGRVFATLAALALELPIYDTQCGAKLFRDNPALRRALARPFHSRWAFDVELIHRLTSGDSSRLTSKDFIEVPLQSWHDAGGSKLSTLDMARAAWDLMHVARDRRKCRRISVLDKPKNCSQHES
jgi:glycosyltransferase involved in cell wall biosynthesis